MKSPLSFSLPLATLISVALGAAQVQFTNTGSISAALPSNAPLSADAASTNTTEVDAAAIECVRNRNPFSLRNMIKRQCDGAIQTLPQDDTQGTFHTGGNDDEFKLPLQRTFENCEVKVGLNYGYDTDDGSWAKLVPLALELSRQCAKASPGISMLGGNRAGYVIAGDHAKIQITILYYDPRAGGNATVTDAYVGGADANTTVKNTTAQDAVLAA
ncbi:hypothetical protein OEA41_008332 [Lepraria neglecta]|uniref:Ecp2 effector protein domain-containing protein n=1 Tax=Lepraria neglecta TaxID=209136 RepID=A0AAD9ZES7_9LECA|nr:hypothetical protein OEA41_008332 [Lepraria neglecta]